MSEIKKLVEGKEKFVKEDILALGKEFKEGKPSQADVDLILSVWWTICDVPSSLALEDSIPYINAVGSLANTLMGLSLLTDKQKDDILVRLKNSAYKIFKARQEKGDFKLPYVCTVKYEEKRVITEQFLLMEDSIFGDSNLLLIIDEQEDFASSSGNLYVMGGEEVDANICAWINLHRDKITEILASRDDHYPSQIGMAGAWLDKDGHMAPTFTKISANEVESGIYIPRYTSKERALEYLRAIEAKGSIHTLWPDHCIHGSTGQQFSKELVKTLKWWSEAHGGKHYRTIDKGNRDDAEMYSIFSYADGSEPEYTKALLDNIANQNFDRIFICGLAKDICVAASVSDLVKDERFRGKLVFLDRCMAAINTKAKSLKVYDDAVKNFGAQRL